MISSITDICRDKSGLRAEWLIHAMSLNVEINCLFIQMKSLSIARRNYIQSEYPTTL